MNPQISTDKNYQVYFYEAFQEETELLKSLLPNDILVGFSPYTIQECNHDQPPAPFISIRTQSLVPDEWLIQLDGILSRSTGYEHLLKLRSQNASIQLGYLPLYCARAVAEQAMLLWCALLRKLPQQMTSFAFFQRDGLTGSECAGKTLLVVGVGNIGYEIVKIGRGLGMTVFGVDIVERHADVNYVTFSEGICAADIIVSAMNLTPENVGYFSYDRLKMAKATAIFINIARGEQSPSTDLLRLLKEKRLSGVAMDVFNEENILAVNLRSGIKAGSEELNATLALSQLPNVILTPHNAFNTFEAVQRKAEQSVQQVLNFLKQRTFIWNVPQQ